MFSRPARLKKKTRAGRPPLVFLFPVPLVPQAPHWLWFFDYIRPDPSPQTGSLPFHCCTCSSATVPCTYLHHKEGEDRERHCGQEHGERSPVSRLAGPRVPQERSGDVADKKNGRRVQREVSQPIPLWWRGWRRRPCNVGAGGGGGSSGRDR